MRGSLRLLIVATSVAVFARPERQELRASPPADSCDLPLVRSRAATAAERGVTGRYANGQTVVYVATCHDSLAVSPAHWAGIEYLTSVRGDSFAVPTRPHRTIVLERGADNRIGRIRTSGFGLPVQLNRMERSQSSAIERLLAGDVDAAYRLANPAADSGRAALAICDQVSDFPTKRLFAVELRTRIAAQFANAHSPAPATAALAASDSGWHVPFAVSALFTPPTAAERDESSRAIGARTRVPRDVHVLLSTTVAVEQDSFSLRVLSYTVGATKLIGAVVVPLHPAAGCCAVLADIKGTDPYYSPLDLTRGPATLPLLGTAATSFVLAVPAIRGESLIVGEREFTSNGDRTDGWDGGADDAIALISAVRAVEPRADTSRVCVYGRSRGGGVALLVGSRDRRVRCVVAISPPVDWFDAMWWNGRPREEKITRALAMRARPDQAAGGQFIEWVLAPVIEGRWTLSDARRRMIAMSPLYSLDRLPPLLAFHGEEDGDVPARNGRILDSALAARPARAQRPYRVAITPWAGHDADPLLIVRDVPAFLARYLGTPVGRRYPGSDAR